MIKAQNLKKKIFFKEIIYFHFMTYMVTPYNRNPYLGGHKNHIHIFVNFSFVIITMHSYCQIFT